MGNPLRECGLSSLTTTRIEEGMTNAGRSDSKSFTRES